MSIDTSNSNSTPCPAYGASYSYPDEDNYYTTTNASRGSLTSILKPSQVIGLVPVFPCCEDDSTPATGGFVFTDTETVSYIDIKVGNIDFGVFQAGLLETNAVIQSRINAILNPSGFTAVVTTLFSNRTVVITAPPGSGDVYNGYAVVIAITGDAVEVSTTTMSGGYDNSNSDCDCREGKYTADYIADDRQWTLPVFAETVSPSNDPYKNDYNAWLFELPSGNQDNTSYSFTLQQFSSGSWTDKADLHDNTYGEFIELGSMCTNIMWTGYSIEWRKVLQTFGQGIFRFKVDMTQLGAVSPCYASPPFCLGEWECYAVDRTVKFEANYMGGRFGNIDKTNCAGKFWDLCCITLKGPTGVTTSKPINYNDSIRLPGWFGRETKDYERTSIKYQTGFVNKIRDEAIRKFSFYSGSIKQTNPGVGWPIWVHDRLSVYGLMADTLYVSDYNLNNPDYNFKSYCVIFDGNYEPKYSFSKRYANVELKFKARMEYLIRTRCC